MWQSPVHKEVIFFPFQNSPNSFFVKTFDTHCWILVKLFLMTTQLKTILQRNEKSMQKTMEKVLRQMQDKMENDITQSLQELSWDTSFTRSTGGKKRNDNHTQISRNHTKYVAKVQQLLLEPSIRQEFTSPYTYTPRSS